MLLMISSGTALFYQTTGSQFDPIKAIQKLQSQNRRDEALDLVQFYEENKTIDPQKLKEMKADLEYTIVEKFKSIAMGAKQVTYGPGSQAWFGDLMTTCFGKSRNRELGELIGKGVDVKAATDSMVKNNKSIEGYITTEVVHNLLKEYKIIAPLLNDIHNVLYKDKKSRDFVTHFIKAW